MAVRGPASAHVGRCAWAHEPNPPARRPAVYQPRRLVWTVVYQVVQQHLESGLEIAHAGDGGEDAVPAYIERDFRQVPDLWPLGERLCPGAL